MAWNLLTIMAGNNGVDLRYRTFLEFQTTLRIWATTIILQNYFWEIRTTLDLSLVELNE